MVRKSYENSDIKITVEELETLLAGPRYISTFWDKNKELEVDRKVSEFETFGGAMSDAFENLTQYLRDNK